MRIPLFAAVLAALALLVPPEALRSVLATASSALFEATPFVLGGVVLSRALRQPHWSAYLGCGCTDGPSARSLPAAVATWFSFGPLVAIARFTAAVLVSTAIRRTRCTHDEASVLGELRALLPAAILAGIAMQSCALVDVARAGTAANVAIGAFLGASAPCALGSVAIAGALHARAPLAAAAFLCVAGIIDARTLLLRRAHDAGQHDAFAYVLTATALAIVAWRNGGALVHPALTGVLAACAGVAAWLARAYRDRVCPPSRIAPAIMLAGALVAAPPPVYRATETTLTELFAGERLDFTGVLTRDARNDALVRFAITCCRADAAPIAVRLTQRAAIPSGSWVHAEGTMEGTPDDLRLRATALERIAPPSDPFTYR